MPLVVPGVQTSSADKTEEFTMKLAGKKIDEIDKDKDLPKEHRIIRPGQMVTKDFNSERLNVHVDDNGVISHVAHG
ncbi:hypothetical protein MCOR25_005332 [Pyricularia grisea]|uniref:Proteinase inhibitor I78 n=1 Tax=Pyricularia grisea TaxID=148305 RepID=A0A6P8B6E1_PYRGI|nr:hypothetical protein PgNI_06620 [Pyricularia grisea]KAI6365556.1 hypothetical protein MCOR25_005332 [Pyricularia grisea]TLD10823.1 hypothetical protein PgNI_06620 [Pyricularia grisea]